MALSLRYAVRSDQGLVRGNNEDSVYAGPRLLAIADGMGGHAAGEVASRIMISSLEGLDEDRSVPDLTTALRECVADGNQHIAEATEEHPELDGMGTTLTALRFAGSHVGLAHVGDSRAYLLRGDSLTQITHDDTYVQFLVDTGKLTPEQAKDHPRKSVILKALTGSDVEPYVAIRESLAGDRYMLCTDGLSDVVSHDTIKETLQIPGVQDSADRLVELALRGGGPDNVTVIVADVIEARPGESIDDVPVIDGAFVEQEHAPADSSTSPAERAAGLTRPARSGASGDPRPTHAGPVMRRRTVLAAIIATAVVLAGLFGGYLWTRTQYFVGQSGDYVSIYRGVDADFGVGKLYENYELTDLKVKDLYPTYQQQVRSGITAQSLNDARDIVDSLRSEMLPLCSQLTLSPPAPSGSASGTPSGGTASGASSTRARSGSASPSGQRTTGLGALPSDRLEPSTPPVNTTSPVLPTPGTNCRP